MKELLIVLLFALALYGVMRARGGSNINPEPPSGPRPTPPPPSPLAGRGQCNHGSAWPKGSLMAHDKNWCCRYCAFVLPPRATDS